MPEAPRDQSPGFPVGRISSGERFLYIFLDEAGNLDFSRNGTRYFVLAGVAKERPFHA